MLLALAMCVAGVSGSDPPVFAGVAVRGAVKDADVVQVTEQLRQVFGARGARVVTPVERKATLERERRVLKDLDERLDDAARAAADDDWNVAREVLQDALALFEEHLAFTEDDAAWARYREMLILQSTALLKVKDKAGADRALLQLLAVEPDWRPQKGVTPVDVAARFDIVRDESRSTPPVSLEVKSRPAGAKVLVDGRRAGRAPVAVEVPPGVHYVIVEESGRVHRQRVVVTESGGRVSARLGSPELEASLRLTSQLRKPETRKADLLELAYDVADVAVVAVVLPYGQSVQVVCARVTDGELDAVVGAPLPRGEGAREKVVFNLVEAALTQKADGWVGTGDPAVTLRPLLLTGVGDATINDAPEPAPVGLIIGGVAGGLAVVAAIGLGVGLVIQNEGNKDKGFTYGVDASALE
ncbi:MAG: PEGA domain-containing protein [Deltaproteobacteria bacterium]|nr:PEGA domain-containing protein [Deltaproteobacteria bacterium]